MRIEDVHDRAGSVLVVAALFKHDRLDELMKREFAARVRDAR
jgi:hypothetical protein